MPEVNTYISDLEHDTTPDPATCSVVHDDGTDTKRSTIMEIFIAALGALPTADPAEAGLPWIDGDTLKISAG